MTDHVAEETYSLLGRHELREEQEWFYGEAVKRNAKAIHIVTLMMRWSLKDREELPY